MSDSSQVPADSGNSRRSGVARDAEAIASLLDLTDPQADWTDTDLADIFNDVLDGPPGHTEEVSAAGATSVRQILLASPPSMNELIRVKRWAKVRRGTASSDGVPADVFRVLYFAAIAAAAVATGQSISELPKRDLAQGYGWAIDRAWVHASIQDFLRHALAATHAKPA